MRLFAVSSRQCERFGYLYRCGPLFEYPPEVKAQVQINGTQLPERLLGRLCQICTSALSQALSQNICAATFKHAQPLQGQLLPLLEKSYC